MLSGKKPSINSVDGACNPEAISEVFASKYETLFQGTPTYPVELQSLYRTIKTLYCMIYFWLVKKNNLLLHISHKKLGKN